MVNLPPGTGEPRPEIDQELRQVEDLVASEAAEGRLPGVDQAPGGVQERQQQAEQEMVALRQLQREDLESQAEVLDYQIGRLQNDFSKTETNSRRATLRGAGINRSGRFNNQAAEELRTGSRMKGEGERKRLGTMNTQLQQFENKRLTIQMQIDELVAKDRAGLPDTMVPRNTQLSETGVDPNKRFSPLGVPDSSFQLSTLENAKFERYTQRWNTAKTQEEKDLMEGFLMMEGVDVDASNLQKEELVVLPENERGFLFFMGLIRALKAIFEKLGNKKTPVDQLIAKTGTDDPKDMAPGERKSEIEANDKKLKEMNGTKGKLTKETKELQAKLDDKAKPPEGEAKTKVEAELKTKTEELEKITKEIENLDKRQEALKEAEKNPPKEKEKSERPDDAQVIADFNKMKEEIKKAMPECIEFLMREANIELKNNIGMQVLLSSAGVDVDKIHADKELAHEFGEFMAMFIDSIDVEADGKGKYRMKIDMNKLERLAQTLPHGKGFQFKEEDLEKAFNSIHRTDPEATLEGKVFHSGFMSEKQLRKEMGF